MDFYTPLPEHELHTGQSNSIDYLALTTNAVRLGLFLIVRWRTKAKKANNCYYVYQVDSETVFYDLADKYHTNGGSLGAYFKNKVKTKHIHTFTELNDFFRERESMTATEIPDLSLLITLPSASDITF